MSAIFKVVFECEIPSVPNFLRSSQGQTIGVEDCTDEGLQQLGEQWTAKLIEHARRRRLVRALPLPPGRDP